MPECDVCCGYEQMNASIENPPESVDFNKYAKIYKPQGSACLSSAEIDALESFYDGLKWWLPPILFTSLHCLYGLLYLVRYSLA